MKCNFNLPLDEVAILIVHTSKIEALLSFKHYSRLGVAFCCCCFAWVTFSFKVVVVAPASAVVKPVRRLFSHELHTAVAVRLQGMYLWNGPSVRPFPPCTENEQLGWLLADAWLIEVIFQPMDHYQAWNVSIIRWRFIIQSFFNFGTLILRRKNWIFTSHLFPLSFGWETSQVILLGSWSHTLAKTGAFKGRDKLSSLVINCVL